MAVYSEKTMALVVPVLVQQGLHLGQLALGVEGDQAGLVVGLQGAPGRGVDARCGG